MKISRCLKYLSQTFNSISRQCTYKSSCLCTKKTKVTDVPAQRRLKQDKDGWHSVLNSLIYWDVFGFNFEETCPN